MSAADLLAFVYGATDDMYRTVEEYFMRTGRSPERLVLTHWWTNGTTMIEYTHRRDAAGEEVEGPFLALWLSVPERFELKVGVGTAIALHGPAVPVVIGAGEGEPGWHMTPGRH
jgi:hypothetical protein